MFSASSDRANNKSIFSCLIVYRWITLAHVFILLVLSPHMTTFLARCYFLFFLAFFYTLSLTLFYSKIYRQTSWYPALLGMDLFVAILLMSFCGGWRNIWYLYSFSPILTAAFFYKMKGGFITAAISSFAYLFALYVNGYSTGRIVQMGHLDDLISNIFSYFLIAAFFAYPCILLDHLRKSRVELASSNKTLEAANKQLSILYELSPLTKREKEILQLIAQSRTNKDQSLYVSEETVKSHVKNIFNKLKFKSRTEAALYFTQLDLNIAQSLSPSLQR